MRTKLIMLSLSALITGAVAFEAKATVAVGTQSLSAPAKSYSLIEKMSCNGRGLFCQAGSSLQCNPICTCVPCSSSPAVRVKHHKHAG
jgi:hypothetical protein